MSEYIAKLRDASRFVKTILLSLVLSIAAGCAGYAYVSSSSEATSSARVRFEGDSTANGYASDGSLILDDAAEFTSSKVLSKAAESLEGITQDMLSSRITVTPIIPEIESDKESGAAKNGHEYEYQADEYTITYVTDGDDNPQSTLSAVLSAIRDNYAVSHSGDSDLPHPTRASAEEDLIIRIDAMETEADEMAYFLRDMAQKYPSWRSRRTGYSYFDLAEQYEALSSWTIEPTKVSILAQKLSKNPTLLVSDAQRTISANESAIAALEQGIEETKDLIRSYSEKRDVGDFEMTQNILGNNYDFDAIGTEVLDDVREDGARDKPAYDEIMHQFISYSDNIVDKRAEIDEKKLIIATFSEAEKSSQQAIADTENTLDDIENRLGELYSEATATDDEHDGVLGAQGLVLTSSPDRVDPPSAAIRGAMLSIGTFVLIFLGTNWVLNVKDKLSESTSGAADEDSLCE